MLHPYSLCLVIRQDCRRSASPVFGVSHREPIKEEFMVRVSDCVANAIVTDGDMLLKYAPEIVNEPVRHEPHLEIAATCLAATLVAPPINKVRVSVEKNPDNRAGSIEVAKSESYAAFVRSDRCSFDDRLHSLQKELRDIRHLLEDVKSKVPNSVAVPANHEGNHGSVSASSMEHGSDEDFN